MKEQQDKGPEGEKKKEEVQETPKAKDVMDTEEKKPVEVEKVVVGETATQTTEEGKTKQQQELEEMDHDGYSSDEGEEEEKKQPYIRPLCMEDFVSAKKEHSASVHEDAHSIAELRRWNEMYGEGGSLRGKGLSYFL